MTRLTDPEPLAEIDEQGTSMLALTRLTGFIHRQVTFVLEQEGVELRDSTRATPVADQTMIDAYGKGWSDDAVAEIHDWSYRNPSARSSTPECNYGLPAAPTTRPNRCQVMRFWTCARTESRSAQGSPRLTTRAPSLEQMPVRSSLPCGMRRGNAMRKPSNQNTCQRHEMRNPCTRYL